MNVKEFRVREFQSVWDSGPITVGEVTCLVGKNEAGKTALLRALYRLNPIVAEDARFDVTDDYPRKEVTDYQHEVAAEQRKPATVIEAKFELDENDASAVTDVFGEKSLTSRQFCLARDYTNGRTYSGFRLDEQAARNHFAETPNLPDTLRKQLSAARDWTVFGTTLAAAEGTAEVVRLREVLAQFGGQEASRYAFNGILNSRIPKFLYFDEYYQMSGHENIPIYLLSCREALRIH
jgi:predicted ATP-dependent endonuclease of OLD family